MKNLISQITIKRNRLTLALGIGLLLLTLIVGIALAHQSPPTPAAHASATVSTVQAGPYTLTWSLTPNPPQIAQAAHLTLHVTDTAKKQPVADAEVQLRGVMESMDMLMAPVYTNAQGDGSYVADMKFSMPGYWRMQVTITRPSAPPGSALIEINSTTP